MKSAESYKNAATVSSVRWAENNRDKVRQYKRDYKRRHLEKVRQSDWNRENKFIVRRMLISARDRAKQNGREFSITEADLVLPDCCPVLGTPFQRERGRWSLDAPSIDRIDSAKGYVPGNVQIISKLANTMKNCATAEQLLAFAAWVTRTYQTGD